MAEPQSQISDLLERFKNSTQNIRLFLNIYEILIDSLFNSNPDDRSRIFVDAHHLKAKYVPGVLFETFSYVLSLPKWFYNPEKTERTNLLAEPLKKRQDIDCVEITEAFMDLSIMLGVDEKEVQEIVYRQRLSKKLKVSHPDISGPFRCFDPKADDYFESMGDIFCFHKHCVAKVYDTYYDLTFLCFYKKEFATFDSSPIAKLIHAAKNQDMKTFTEILEANPELDLNEKNPGRDILVCCSERYEPFLPTLKWHQKKLKKNEIIKKTDSLQISRVQPSH